MSNPQSRKWNLVINNPIESNIDHKVILSILELLHYDYACMSDEISSSGTYHTHIFVYSSAPIRFSTLKRRFPAAHIEKAYGTVAENRDYIAKEGKWSDTDKAETSVKDTFEEYGEIPEEGREKSSQLSDLLDDVRAGKSTIEIISENPKLSLRVKEIDCLRQTYLSEKYAGTFRDLETIYVYGDDSTDRTKYVYSLHNGSDIYRVTSHRQTKGLSFDGYHAQAVLLFDLYYSQVPITEFITYLGEAPLSLPARYADRTACYTHVYIVSTIPPECQYEEIRARNHDLWKLFADRIDKVILLEADGTERVIFDKGKEPDGGTALSDSEEN